jgi:hypothetical protein
MRGLLFSRGSVDFGELSRQAAQFCRQEEILAPINDGEMFGRTFLRGITTHDSCCVGLQLSSLIAHRGDGNCPWRPIWRHLGLSRKQASNDSPANRHVGATTWAGQQDGSSVAN